MSSFIQLSHLSFQFDNHSVPLLSEVSGSFHAGWTSICGPNGCGKTTLLKLISGQLHPNSGFIEVHGSMVAIPQSTENQPNGLEDYRYNYDGPVIKLRELLGIVETWYDRWDTLSIGERKRLQLAVALSMSPDILLVDEPTNHVDAPTRELILLALRKFRGVGILVSHDRLLLNELCTRTAFLEFGELRIFSAPYDVAKTELENQLAMVADEKTKLKKEQARTARSVQAQSEEIAKNKSKLSKRGLSSKDHDAKAKVNLAKLTGADSGDSRKKQTLNRKLEKVSDSLASIRIKKTHDLGVFFEKLPQAKMVHLKDEKLETGYASISYPEIILHPGDKLAITGANGAGKSTLLKSWLDILPKPYAYGPQEFTHQETQRIANELAEFDKKIRGKVMTLVSCFGSDPKSLSSGSPPSPGVWQKLVIAQAIVNASPLLVLDEPTNHMDLAAIEVLEQALTEYRGSMICISHDAEFIKRVCNLELRLVKSGVETAGDLKT